ncbi:peptidoglycan-binding protein [Eubacteriales bacterium OttesenSCG-928-N13]|nr:peptidoglycan-binding protein [Eubacteriales bacterium OttesenSCG-928-N13]
MNRHLKTMLALALAILMTLGAVGLAETLPEDEYSEYDENYDSTENYDHDIGSDYEDIRQLNTIEVSLHGDFVAARKVGQDAWQDVDTDVLGVAELGGLLYYVHGTEEAYELRQFDFLVTPGQQVMALPDHCTGALCELNGELYVIDADGSLYQVRPADRQYTLLETSDAISNADMRAEDGELVFFTTDEDGTEQVLRRYTPSASAEALDDVDDVYESEIEQPIETAEKVAGSSGYAMLERGDRGELVRKLQRRLAALNYLSGSVDGSFGAQTERAVELFQKAIDWSQTGVATEAMQKRLFASDAPKRKVTTYVELEHGDTGERVKTLQRRLKALGYFNGSIGGNYLDLTETAVKKFQKKIGVKQTGIATVSLQKKLFAKNAPHYNDGYVQLKHGSTGERVKKLQRRLKELGYFTGEIGGNYLDLTESAVKKFQKKTGATQNGIASVSLQKKIFAKNAPHYNDGYVELKYGSTGERVKKLQRRLKTLGYFKGDIGGNYLDLTESAVKKFQKKIGVKQTGVATVSLQKKIFAKNAPHK